MKHTIPLVIKRACFFQSKLFIIDWVIFHLSSLYAKHDDIIGCKEALNPQQPLWLIALMSILSKK